ncbi:MAG: hypothetical protein ACE5MB_09915 [Anaerolineae bacterium]
MGRFPASEDAFGLKSAAKPSQGFGGCKDVLLNLEALVEAGYGGDPRLDEAIQLVLSKQDDHGRWKMEYSYEGKMWADVEKKGKPSKWVTLRALRVIKLWMFLFIR